MLFVSQSPYIHRAWNRLSYFEKKYGLVGIYSPSFTTNPYHPHMIRTDGQGFKRVCYVDGIAPLICLRCLEDIGGLDKGDNDIGYGVDAWVSLRASRKGWGVVVDQEVAGRHRYHGSARELDGFMKRAADLEQRYLFSRLGSSYRLRLREWACNTMVLQ